MTRKKKVSPNPAIDSATENWGDRTLDDETIKEFWAYHFPRRRESTTSKAALIKLIRIVSERSCSCANFESIAHAAQRFGIPLAEFYEFERDGQ
jgi:hypothetical protein